VTSTPAPHHPRRPVPPAPDPAGGPGVAGPAHDAASRRLARARTARGGPRGARASRRISAATALTLLVTTVAGTAVASSAAATPGGGHGGGAPRGGVETVAGIAPALLSGRGAHVPFVEQEAENASFTGSLVGPGRDAFTLASEASGRAAVELERGEHVRFTLTRAADALTVRYALPDAPRGGGLSGTLALMAKGVSRDVPVTSKYSWLYNQYPFSNDPQAGLLHPDWWVAECGCVPAETSPAPVFDTPFRPSHFYAEQRVLLGRTLKAGDTVTLTLPKRSSLPWAVIDLVDLEKVGAPKAPPRRSVNAWLLGADPTGRRDSAPAMRAAIALARKLDRPVYVPPGTYRVDEHLVVDDVTIAGAGSWYTVFRGREVALPRPAADGSTHTGVGFYGKPASEGGSRGVHLRDFAIVGDVAERIDDDQVNGVGGAMSDSTITGLYIKNTKVGLWFDGPMSNLRVERNVVVDQIADGLNFHRGVTGSLVRDNLFRNTGDDALASWSQDVPNARNVFDSNTIQVPTLANGIALYGGTDLTMSNNVVADPVREGSALHLGSRFGATAFAGTIAVRDNTTVRGGPLEPNWKIGTGALWVYALERSIDADVQVVGDHFLDSTYNAVMLVAEWGVKDQYAIENVHFKDVRIDGTGTNAISARAMGSATFQNVDARHLGSYGVNNCGTFHWDWDHGSEFTLVDLGGNDGTSGNPWDQSTNNWLTRFTPNTITCNDTPPVVPPPAPSPWVQPVG